MDEHVFEGGVGTTVLQAGINDDGALGAVISGNADDEVRNAVAVVVVAGGDRRAEMLI